MDRPNDTTTHTEPPEQPGTTRANCFVTTHWSVVLSAQEKNSSRAAEARFATARVRAWSPLLLVCISVVILKSSLGTFGAALMASLFTGGLAILSVALPGRGLPDRLAGTWPVPR